MEWQADVGIGFNAVVWATCIFPAQWSVTDAWCPDTRLKYYYETVVQVMQGVDEQSTIGDSSFFNKLKFLRNSFLIYIVPTSSFLLSVILLTYILQA